MKKHLLMVMALMLTVVTSMGQTLNIGGHRAPLDTLNHMWLCSVPQTMFGQDFTATVNFGDEPFAKLRWDCREQTTDTLSFRARRGDIDLNGHVNNVHYVEWLMEGRPDAAGPCRELDIVFKSETLAGEKVCVESVEVEPGVFIHRVYAPDGHDHVLARTR